MKARRYLVVRMNSTTGPWIVEAEPPEGVPSNCVADIAETGLTRKQADRLAKEMNEKEK